MTARIKIMHFPSRFLMTTACLLCMVMITLLQAGEAIELAQFHANGVAVRIRLEQQDGPQATLVATFTPDINLEHPWHLYSVDLPPEGIDGIGVPTRLDLAPDHRRHVAGPLQADQTPYQLSTLDLPPMPVYPDGPVTLRRDIILPRGDGQEQNLDLLISYMACSAVSCLMPEQRQLSVLVPSHPDGVSEDDETDSTDDRSPDILELLGPAGTQRARVATGPADLSWQMPETRDDLGAELAWARAHDRSALIDFTGPSCAICRIVHRTVFPLPAITAALESLHRIEINTDRHRDLAHWQQEMFATQARPLYVRVDPDGRYEVWGRAPSASDHDDFAAFLRGGSGIAVGRYDGWGQLILWAILGGLLALLMPCTYPMIPLTVAFFTRQSESGRRLPPLALAYGAGIVISFTALGALIAGVIGSTPGAFAGSPWTNLIIALVFAILGASMIDLFTLRLPSGVASGLSGSRSGYVGALVMGLTYAVAAFTCTAPFIGVVLAQATLTGAWAAAIIGMLIFSSTIAVPIMILALSPALLAKLPRNGSWMHEFKVIAGLVILTYAVKFLSISDHIWDWGIIGRQGVLALWSAMTALIALYILGLIRTHADQDLPHISPQRLLLAAVFLALAIACAAALTGAPLGWLEQIIGG